MELGKTNPVLASGFVTLKQLQEQWLREKQLRKEAEEEEKPRKEREREREKEEDKLRKNREAPTSKKPYYHRLPGRNCDSSSKGGVACERKAAANRSLRMSESVAGRALDGGDRSIPDLQASDRVDEEEEGKKKSKSKRKRYQKKKSNKAVAEEEVAQDIGGEANQAAKGTARIEREPKPSQEDSAGVKGERQGAPPRRSQREHRPVGVPGGEAAHVAQIEKRIGELRVDSGVNGRNVGVEGKGELQRNRKSTVGNRGRRVPSFGMRRGGAATAGGGLVWVKKTPEA